MGFLKGRRGASDGRQLAKALRLGLASYGSRTGEVVGWVLTGSPSNIILTSPTRAAPILGSADQHEAIMANIGDADPIVEWRLGLLVSEGTWATTGPTRALYGLWYAHYSSWPDDERIDDMLAAAGVSRGDHLADLLVNPKWGHDARKQVLRGRPSFDRLVRDYPEIVRGRLNGDANEVDGVATALMSASVEALSQYSETIAGLMSDSSKKRRAAGAKLGNRVGYPPLAEPLQQLVTSAAATVRAEAIRSLGRLGGDSHRDELIAFCKSNCADDRSSGVQEAIADLAKAHGAVVEGLDVELPDPDHTLPDDTARAAYDSIFEKVYEADRARYEREKQWLKDDPASVTFGRAREMGPEPARRIPQEVAVAGWSYICDGGSAPVGIFNRGNLAHHARQVVGDLQPLHAFRLLRILSDRLRWDTPFPALLSSYEATGHPTPMEIQAAAEDVGFGRRDVLAAIPNNMPWSADDTWPWVAALLSDFMDIIEAGETDRWGIDKYYDAIGCLPTLPADLRRLLLAQAVSGRLAHRPLAKAAMAGDEDLVSSVIDYLGSRKFAERAEAALWLADLGADQATQALHKAAAKEKHDHAKGAILTALERLGEPIDKYLDRKRLLAESNKGLAKKIPNAAEWIALDSLPSLRWDDGTPVDSAIPKWLVVQAVRLKSAAPSPIVRRYFEQMNSEDVERFADTVLTMWLAEDIRPITVEAATDRARQGLRGVRNAPQWHEDLASMTDDQIVVQLISRHLAIPAGSAAASKGVLSLAAAGGGLTVVAPTEAYLRKWYGNRSGQCKALVEMLAWVDDPTAIQLVLSVGSRFRTKGIQQEAVRQAGLLAERKGWTVDDLAYRTVPTGGFDAEGTRVLDYGERQFTARLADDLTIVLSNADGKRLKSLPAPRKTEEESLVKLAKKELSGAKKHLKAAAKEQPRRLHEAMCVQRRFEVDDYHRYVLAHPVMSRLATRLLWAAASADGDHTLFRPLSDGTLLDKNDEAVSLTNATAVRLAHGAIDGEEAGLAWKQHFADYRIARLFPQFGRPQIPEFAPGQEKFTDCRGAIIDDRRLRSAIGKIGYILGPSEDAGFVPVITRSFPSAGLEARINVRGLHAMILEQLVGLQELEFGRIDGYETIALAEVPPVLLVETIADVNQIVAAGEGIAEGWEERVAW